MQGLRIGMATPAGLWKASRPERVRLLEEASEAGVDHVFIADHVSFRNGSGKDGFVEIAALSQLHDTLGLMIGIYLLPLRHPLPVARQLATMHEIAPGRTMFGIGIGGEDRHEIEVCGVDPRTRGKRTNESLAIIRELMAGENVNFDGEFFQLSMARIRPRIDQPIPIIVGGRSNAALIRAGRFGDGWIGTWCSVKRFQEAVSLIDESASAFGRGAVNWMHGYQPWVGIADDKAAARKLVAEAMEAFYHIPFEQFERYVPYGTPEEVAAELAPYVQSGCRILNMKVVAENDHEAVRALSVMTSQLRHPN